MRTWDWGKASTEANEGNEGDSVGETPTGATGTGAVPEGLGRNQLKASLKSPLAPLFAQKAGWLCLYSPLWGCAEPAAFAPGKLPRRSAPRSFPTGSDKVYIIKQQRLAGAAKHRGTFRLLTADWWKQRNAEPSECWVRNADWGAYSALTPALSTRRGGLRAVTGGVKERKQPEGRNKPRSPQFRAGREGVERLIFANRRFVL